MERSAEKRGELDGNDPLAGFGHALEASCLETLNGGTMTKDLAEMAEGLKPNVVNTEQFIKAIAERLNEKMHRS
jgi:isocitrate dehydrogenase